MSPSLLRSRLLSRSCATLAAGLLSGCLDVGPASSNLSFDFTTEGLASGWTLGVADVPTARAGEVDAVGEERALPTSFSSIGKSMYLSGTNVSGDLFVFQQKYFGGLHVATNYKVSLQIEFVTNVHSGCNSGVGPSVVFKAGLTSTEPRAQPDAQDVLRMNVDKGAGTARGVYAQLGDIRNGLPGCPTTGTYASHTTAVIRQTEIVHTDTLGGFYIFIGTQSSFAGRAEVYILALSVQLEEQP